MANTKNLELFKTNTSLKAYFETSDGHAFYSEGDAKLHAKSLKDKAVTKVERPLEKEGKKQEVEVETPKKKLSNGTT